MVMAWGLFLLALSATCFSINAQYDGSADTGINIGFSSNGAEFNSYFNSETCRGGDCGGYGTISDPDEQGDQEPVYPDPLYPEHPVYPQDPVYPDQPVTPESVYPQDPVYPDEPVSPEPVYPEHPIYPDPEPQYPSSTTEYPEIVDDTLCRLILDTAEELQARHPDIKPFKFQVVNEILEAILEYAYIESDDCDPPVKLLDFIIMASNKVKASYTVNSDTYCEFQEADEQSESSSSDYDQVEGTGSPYPEVTSPHTVTIEYEPSDEPCTEPSTPGYEPSMKPCPEKPTPAYPSYEPQPEVPCPDNSCKDYVPTEEIIAEDDEYVGHLSPPFVGSHRGIPGVHYPNYTEVPITSFSCADKKYIPGFYADLETGCQVFHVCYEHRRESFLCPIGTIFNQPILACDYWYSSNCSECPKFYDVNVKTLDVSEPDVDDLPEEVLDELVQFLPVKAKVTVFPEPVVKEKVIVEKPDVKEEKVVIVKKPVAQEVPEVASDIFDKIISTTRIVPKPIKSEVKVHIKKPVHLKPVLFKPKAVVKAKVLGKVALAKASVPVIAKAKVAAAVPVKILAAKAAVPVIAKKKVAAAATAKLAAGKVIAAKAAIPVAAKVKLATAAKAKVAAGKVAAVKVAVPVMAKTKLAAGVKVAVPVAAKAKLAAAAKVAVPAKVIAGKKLAVAATVPIAKTKLVAAGSAKVAVKAAPVLKGKILAASLPFAKTALLKSAIPAVKSVPIMKAKLASVPVVKGKLLALPLAKAKFAYSAPILKAKAVKAVAISPLTKKALALGYMKLLKAKKLALMG